MPFKESVTIDDAIHLLNEMLLADREAALRLISSRVPVNADLAKHPTLMVLKVGEQEALGVLGVINGLFGNENGYGPIIALQQDGEIVVFTHTPKELYETGDTKTS